MNSKIHYARSGGVHIAYQVLGTSGPDLVLVPGWVSNIEAFWDHPLMARFLGRLASFSRLILFDKRGTGLSDRVSDDQLPTLEERMDDVRAVMDAVGSERAALFGYSEGGPMSILFAASHPVRTTALACYGTYAKREWSVDYQWAPTQEERERWLEMLDKEWGGVTDLRQLAPSVADDRDFQAWWSSFLRRSASPSAAIALGRMNTKIDVRDVLGAVRVPTVIMHRRGDRDSHIEEGRFIAGRIPGARFIELSGEDHLPWIGDVDSIVTHVRELVVGSTPPPFVDRILTTVLLVDVVDSTRHAASVGDQSWTVTMQSLFTLAKSAIDRFRGELIKTTGDGVLAIFDGPARAAQCGCALRNAARDLGIELRVGLHTGEVERTNADVSGIAVHVTARIMDRAGPGQVLGSSTVRDLVSGSGLAFEDCGSFRLRGIQRDWQLFSISVTQRGAN